MATVIKDQNMKRIYGIILKSAAALFLCACLTLVLPQNALNAIYHTADTERLSADDIPQNDFNRNGKVDSLDILEGARLDAQNMPTYDGSYWENGYPPDNIGVCTDVVWRAFRNAGYSLRKMVDTDVKTRPEAYPNIRLPDDNIDFRRVVNLRVFFDTHAIPLTTDPSKTDQWQPGDIVVFCNKFGKASHVGIISDKRAEDGTAFVIHNSGQDDREENVLYNMPIIGHYRFDASLLDDSMILAWNEIDDKDLIQG